MDRKADPRKDFYRYATGRWISTHPLPPDKSRYGSFTELSEWNLLALKKIAERCAAPRSIAEGGTPALVGKFYRSALDSRARERSGFGPIEDLWRDAEGVGSPEDVAALLPRLHADGFGAGFQAFSKADDRDSGVYAFFMWQGGLTLPDRDYYAAASFAKTRAEYIAHMQTMFELKGLSSQEAKKRSQSVMRLETALARASRSRTDLRDPVKNYNRVEAADLDGKFPHILPSSYLASSGIPAKYVVLGQPEFLSAMDSLLAEVALEDWSAYLSWSVLTGAAPFLHGEAEDENFDFFHRRLVGQKEPEPVWKRALKVLDAMIGEALGSLYVAEHFPEEARRRAAELVQNLSDVFEGRLRALPWMTESTRAEALEKFRRFRVKIGHPPKFRDYSSIRVEQDDFAGNARRAAAFEFARQAARVGAPVDRDEWFMTPPTVNAYFSPETNEIVFPAGILQPPFFDHRADDAVNYGGIGAVIGHEITHGYDDQGRQYDSKGTLRDWWTKDDERAFNKRADGVVKAYGAQEVLPGLKLNGKLTLGENIADLGGLSIAYEALQRQLEKGGGARKKIGGLTPEQRFFVSWGQIWRMTIAKQEARRLVTIDPHSPGKFRAVIPATNNPAFDEAFPPKKSGRPAPKIGVW
ncbi:MAG: M13 family metallopeptidase [Nitrososphaerota archaeon]|nr:M13 family metallopeptidase [Nitrososphaerota archaeon]